VGGNLRLRVALSKQQEGSLLLGSERLEGDFKIEPGEELLLLLISQGCPDFQLSGAEGLGSLLNFAQVEIPDTLAAQRRIPRWDPDRLALRADKNGGPNPNGFEPPLLRPSSYGPTSLRSLGDEEKNQLCFRRC